MAPSRLPCTQEMLAVKQTLDPKKLWTSSKHSPWRQIPFAIPYLQGPLGGGQTRSYYVVHIIRKNKFHEPRAIKNGKRLSFRCNEATREGNWERKNLFTEAAWWGNFSVQKLMAPKIDCDKFPHDIFRSSLYLTNAKGFQSDPRTERLVG